MIAALMALANVAPLPTTNLTPRIGFADARMCKMVPEGERVMDALGEMGRDARPGVRVRKVSTPGGRYAWMSDLSVDQGPITTVGDPKGGDTDRGAELRLKPGSILYGLPVTSMRNRFQQKAESDAYWSREIVFAAAPAQVHAAMRKLGADVPPAPGYLEIPNPDDEQGGAITIREKGKFTSLTCGWGL